MSAAAPDPVRVEPRRFSIPLPRPLWIFLATVVLVLVAVAVHFGVPIYRQHAAVRTVRRLGGDVEFRMTGPEWLRERLPDGWIELLGRPWVVDFRDARVGDADLELLGNFPEIEQLSLAHTQVTDAGLLRLAPLRRLEVLALDHTAITDDGLRHLIKLLQPHSVSAVASAVTPAGLKRFYAIAPHFYVRIGSIHELPDVEYPDESEVIGETAASPTAVENSAGSR